MRSCFAKSLLPKILLTKWLQKKIESGSNPQIPEAQTQRVNKSCQFSDMASFEGRLEITFVTDDFYISIYVWDAKQSNYLQRSYGQS